MLMTYRISLLTTIAAYMLLPVRAHAQYAWQGTERTSSQPQLDEDIEYKVESQISLSNDKTPLWLNANKYGLSSLDKTNGYMRTAITRPLQADSARRWAIGYGVDVAVPVNYTSNFVLDIPRF